VWKIIFLWWILSDGNWINLYLRSEVLKRISNSAVRKEENVWLWETDLVQYFTHNHNPLVFTELPEMFVRNQFYVMDNITKFKLCQEWFYQKHTNIYYLL
jgi:hypothetical protein